MKILHVITNYAGAGGAEKMLSRLVASAPHCEHSIISLMNISDLYSDSLEQCRFHEALNWNLVNTPIVVWRLKKLIDTLRPDAIQGWMYHANVFASIASWLSQFKPPVVWGIRHSLDDIDSESVSTKVAMYASKLLSHMPTSIIYCAQSSLNQHVKFGFAQHQNIVIPNGVILSEVPDKSFNSDMIVVGFAGRYHAAKGFLYLFEAISLIQKTNSNIFFKLAGRDVSLGNPEILILIDQFQVSVDTIEFCGQVSDMSEFYKNIDLLMLTSITEGFPNVLVEAMAAGVACVSTDVGDARLIVDQAGFVVPAKDSVAISDAILSYASLTDSQKRDLSQKAYQLTQERYQLHVVANMYQETWRCS